MAHVYPDQKVVDHVPRAVVTNVLLAPPLRFPRTPTGRRLRVALAAVWIAAVGWEVGRHTVLAPVLSPGIAFDPVQIFVGALVLGLIGSVLTLAFGRLVLGHEAALQTTAGQLHTTLTSLQETNLATLTALADAIDARDPYTRRHSDAASALAERTARTIGLPDHEVETIRLAAILHDIGKLGIPDNVLCKEGPLLPAERRQVERHPDIGADIIERIPFLRQVAVLVRHHQERYDGEGYPSRLVGELIPLGSRIVAVVDAYNAMTTDRPYRKALTQGQALEELTRHAGTQFDPDVAATFIKVCALPGGHGQPGDAV